MIFVASRTHALQIGFDELLSICNYPSEVYRNSRVEHVSRVRVLQLETENIVQHSAIEVTLASISVSTCVQPHQISMIGENAS